MTDIEAAYEQLLRQIEEVRATADLIYKGASNRAIALAITKIDEAEMWARRAELQHSGAI